ncbi:hypothetical protein J2Z53_001361 [Clostridium moniliforme]|uniref:Uncharacterized protein n=1 Tax=Clostridium moniliforme TaxID=39489 RepID=A0ABS4F0K1_9CLOT|nr:hypothetical protein [Clostridium moniliforme]MBP1889778.1 hypothetical protein [Clostridium moniliforme]
MKFLNRHKYISRNHMLDYKNWLQVNNLKDNFDNFYEYVDNKDFTNLAKLYI